LDILGRAAVMMRTKNGEKAEMPLADELFEAVGVLLVDSLKLGEPDGNEVARKGAALIVAPVEAVVVAAVVEDTPAGGDSGAGGGEMAGGGGDGAGEVTLPCGIETTNTVPVSLTSWGMLLSSRVNVMVRLTVSMTMGVLLRTGSKLPETLLKYTSDGVPPPGG
jgi:hypothetical protein